MEAGRYPVRKRGGEQSGPHALEDIVNSLKEEIRERSLVSGL